MDLSSSSLTFLLNAVWSVLINNMKSSKLVAQRFFKAGIRFLGLLLSFLEEISEEKQRFVGMQTFKAFMRLVVTYSLTILNSVVNFYNMLMKLFTMEGSSAS